MLRSSRRTSSGRAATSPCVRRSAKVVGPREGEPLTLAVLADEVYETLTANGARQGLFWDSQVGNRSTGCGPGRSLAAASRPSSVVLLAGGSRSSRWGWSRSREPRAWQSLLGQLRRELPEPVATHAEALALLLLEQFRERRAISDLLVDFDDESLWGGRWTPFDPQVSRENR